jgi:hypothetical protein
MRPPEVVTQTLSVSDEPRLPCHYPEGSLNHLCELLPGGRRKAMELARIPGLEDERFKTLVGLYDRLPYYERPRVVIDHLCAQAGLPPDEFVGQLAGLAFAHRLDIRHFTEAIVAKARTSMIMREVYLRALQPERLYFACLQCAHFGEKHVFRPGSRIV